MGLTDENTQDNPFCLMGLPGKNTQDNPFCVMGLPGKNTHDNPFCLMGLPGKNTQDNPFCLMGLPGKNTHKTTHFNMWWVYQVKTPQRQPVSCDEWCDDRKHYEGVSDVAIEFVMLE